jgi:hypothetical protein
MVTLPAGGSSVCSHTIHHQLGTVIRGLGGGRTSSSGWSLGVGIRTNVARSTTPFHCRPFRVSIRYPKLVVVPRSGRR